MEKLEDLTLENDYFIFDEKYYQKINPTPLKDAYIISLNSLMLKELGLDNIKDNNEFTKFINGEKILAGSVPFATAYSGHQFGYYVQQLGDGRVINLGKIRNWHLQIKGAGVTNYSRKGDGRAVLRSSIREYIIAEAMTALGIPSTRSLGIIGSDEKVHRYYGVHETGSIVLRVSKSWIRFGTFEYFANYHKDSNELKKLCNYVIKENFSYIENNNKKYEKMYFEIVDKTAILLAKWQAYGFMHGVMNTDNMSVAGLSIDYGPFAFMDYFDIHQICNNSDSEGRYSFRNQAYVAKWNLETLAISLKSICDEEILKEYLKTYFNTHEKYYLELMSKRLGLNIDLSTDSNASLIIELLHALQDAKVDYNQFFYELTLANNYDDMRRILDICINPDGIRAWIEKLISIRKEENIDFKIVQSTMRSVNPKYLIKNYMLQEAIQKAENKDFSLVNDLLKIAQNPFDEHKGFERYSKATPIKDSNLKLSCSS